MNDDKLVKILFRLFSNILDEITVETLWAQKVDEEEGLYKLDNTPFYLPLISCGDIVFAEFDESEGMLTYREISEYSGNSTIHVILLDKSTNIDSIREVFEKTDCTSEKLNDKYFAMDVPADLDYKMVKPVLQKFEGDEILSYSESSLSEKHYYL